MRRFDIQGWGQRPRLLSQPGQFTARLTIAVFLLISAIGIDAVCTRRPIAPATADLGWTST